MTAWVQTLVIGIACAAVAGAASWLIATTRQIAKLEAKASPEPNGQHKALMHNLGAIRVALDEAARGRLALVDRVKAIEVRLETEKEYRWPIQDRAWETATEAIRDGTQSTRSLLDWLTRGDGGGKPPAGS